MSVQDRVFDETLLSVENISLSFGAVRAISDVSFNIKKGEIRAIIGPNGAGKTSMLNCINGFYHPKLGEIIYKGAVRKQMKPYETAANGVARTFQNVALFRGMTTLDNLMTGRNLKFNKWKTCLLAAAIFVGPTRDEERKHRAFVEEIIKFLEIEAIRKTPVGRLPYGLQKRVELGRALAAEPELLLLDEPTAGMSPTETGDAIKLVDRITKERGLTLLFTEHDMGVVFGISDRISVLHHGEIIASGLPDDVRNDPEVRRIYLGEDADAAA